MNLTDAFHDLLDQIYWAGYAIQLMKTEPEAYKWELAEFIKLYK